MMSPTEESDVPSAAIARQLAAVRARIRAAETRAGRAPGSVTLLAVSKGQPAPRLAAAHAAGQTAFGESYLNEALEKIAALAPRALEWHFIGRVQSNKTRALATHFAWLHSLADVTHARRLNDQRPPELPPLNVCIQINIAGEARKAGLAPAAVADFIAAVRPLPRLRLAGLMTLPPETADEAAQRAPFAALRALRDRLATPELPLATLSMGMSQDLEAAIAEGATLVRVGTALFGAR